MNHYRPGVYRDEDFAGDVAADPFKRLVQDSDVAVRVLARDDRRSGRVPSLQPHQGFDRSWDRFKHDQASSAVLWHLLHPGLILGAGRGAW
jgi:hypothetical protein